MIVMKKPNICFEVKVKNISQKRNENDIILNKI